MKIIKKVSLFTSGLIEYELGEATVYETIEKHKSRVTGEGIGTLNSVYLHIFDCLSDKSNKMRRFSTIHSLIITTNSYWVRIYERLPLSIARK